MSFISARREWAKVAMEFSLLEEKMEEIAEIYKNAGRIGIALEWNKKKISVNGDTIFPSASLIKLPILIEGFAQASGKYINLKQLVPISSIQKIGGAGVLQTFSHNSQITIQDLLTLMITVSDNMATNFLIDLLGKDQINNRCKTLNMKNTRLQRDMMDEKARRCGLENYTSPNDILQCLQAISYNREPMLEIILLQQQFRDKLPLYFHEGAFLVANKTGELGGVEHDCAIIRYKQEIVHIAVLMDHIKENKLGKKVFHLIGENISQFLCCQ